MIKLSTLAVPCLAVLGACSSHGAPSRSIAGSTNFDFDRERTDSLPAGWQVGSTLKSGPDATWAVRADSAAHSEPNVLALTSINHRSQDAYNLCWTSGIGFHDGTIELAVKAQDGEIDQGGGVTWRVQGPNDYYLCRYNPLESNFRVYVVRGGVRTQLDTALVGQAGGWHVIRIDHAGDRIECALDGVNLLEASDNSLLAAGGVGVWTKADARTSFDDLRVTPSRP